MVGFESMYFDNILDAVRQGEVGDLLTKVSLAKPSKVQDVTYQESLNMRA